MSFDQLWAPWRIGYITGDKNPKSDQPAHKLAWQPGAEQSCFLCRAVAQCEPASQSEVDKENLVVLRSKVSIVLLNRYPYNNGHLLVAPNRHVATLDQLSDDEHLDMMHQLVRLSRTLQNLMKAEGFNIGLNLGRIAGAGVPGHVHWHIVPRWNGDTNFMPVLAGINVIPQSLEALVDLLRTTLAKSG